MRVKILKYMILPFNGGSKVCDPNCILDLPVEQANELILNEQAIDLDGSDNTEPSTFENKMVDLVYPKKQRGRPRKNQEV